MAEHNTLLHQLRACAWLNRTPCTFLQVMVAKMLAKSYGSLIAPNLVLLFYPITRGSVVLQALQLPYPEAIR
jgi:hypothetical protein